MSGATSRRDALRAAALAGGALAVPALIRPALAQGQDDDEAELEDYLEQAVDLEQAAVLAYDTAADAKGLDTDLKRTFELFRDQEQTHANALRTALDSLGVDPPDPPEDAADSDSLKGLDGLETADEFLEFLAKLEEEELSLYVDMTPDFSSEDLLRTGAEIAACQAQHLVVLNEARGSAPANSVPEVGRGGGDSDGSGQS